MLFNGLSKIALKLLVNDQGKFFTLIIGIAFAVFLMVQMLSAFTGVMQRTAADIFNLGATIWVMDPSINSARDNIPLPNYVLDAVRSIKGVKYAAPVYSGGGVAKLSDGTYQPVNVMGLDDSTLVGRPEVIEGNIHAIYSNDAFLVVKNSDYPKLNNPKIGATFEINDHRVVIVGLAQEAVPGLFGVPMLYTTYSRALTYIPSPRLTIAYVLTEPKSLSDIPFIKQQVQALGYLAMTKEEFIKKNTRYYITKTGFGTNVLIMTLISFVVGLSIAGQTFYTFVLENLEKFGALKAIGAKKSDIMHIILFQAAVVGFLGYGIGTLLSSVVIALAKLRLPNYASTVTLATLFFSFVMVIIIVAFSSYIGVKKAIRVDPFEIFRG